MFFLFWLSDYCLRYILPGWMCFGPHNNSATVTRVYPSFCIASIISDIVCMVPVSVSCIKIIFPGWMLSMICWTNASLEGSPQSLLSKDHCNDARWYVPNICNIFPFCAPYGGLAIMGVYHVILFIAFCVFCISVMTSLVDNHTKFIWSHVWFPIICHSSYTRCTMPENCCTFSPTIKNVAWTFFALRISNNRGVVFSLGPSSKVSATYFLGFVVSVLALVLSNIPVKLTIHRMLISIYLFIDSLESVNVRLCRCIAYIDCKSIIIAKNFF